MAAVVVILYRIRPNFGSAWLLSVIASMAALGLLIAFHWWSPAAFSSNSWLPTSGEGAQILFRVDSISWSYGVSLLGLLMAILLTAPVRLQYRSSPITWSANLAIAGTALLGVLAATPLTLILTWTVLDLIDLVVTMISNADLRVNRAAIISFVFRLTGSLLVAWAMGINRAAGSQLTLEEAQPQAALFLLLAIGLRMGVLPLSLPYYSEALRRRGIGSMIRLAGPAASLGVLAHLPATVAPLEISPFLLALAGMAVLYGAGMWLVSSDEVMGRQYLVLALAGMAVGTAIRGQPQASLAWGVALILSGGLLFLFSTRPPISLVLPILGLIGMSGLPFTPAASGWAGMVVLPFTLPDLLFILAHAILLLGYIRHFIRPGDRPSDVERWTQVAYTIGLFFLAALAWLIGIFGWEGSFTIGVWWASAISIFLAGSAGVIVFILRKQGRNTAQIQQSWFWRLATRIGTKISAVLRLNWLFTFFRFLFDWLQKLIHLMTEMLEGAGGILWVFVLLVLLITVVQAGVK
jgi:hypothetical protein